MVMMKVRSAMAKKVPKIEREKKPFLTKLLVCYIMVNRINTPNVQ